MSSPALREWTDRRVLGGLLFVDAITGSAIPDPLRVASAQLQLRPNRSGVYVVFDGPGFRALTTQFIPDGASWPGPQSFEISVQDPSLRYLARRAQIQAPQPLNAATTLQTVTLYPSAAAEVAPNWAVVRASVVGTSGAGLPYCVLRIVRGDNSVAATAITDVRGEGLLAVAGIGVQVSGDVSGAVTETTTPVTVQAWFDPAARNQPAGWIPNPDDILGSLSSTAWKTGAFTGPLGPRQVLFAKITIAA